MNSKRLGFVKRNNRPNIVRSRLTGLQGAENDLLDLAVQRGSRKANNGKEVATV